MVRPLNTLFYSPSLEYPAACWSETEIPHCGSRNSHTKLDLILKYFDTEILTGRYRTLWTNFWTQNTWRKILSGSVTGGAIWTAH